MEIKNGDEIMLLKEGEQVLKKDEIGFIYSLLVDKSKKAPNSDSKMTAEDEETKKRNLEEITKAKEEHEKEQAAVKQKMNTMGEQFECGICYEIMH